MRVSQINDCGYRIEYHSKDSLGLGEDEHSIYPPGLCRAEFEGAGRGHGYFEKIGGGSFITDYDCRRFLSKFGL
jgi:hypothetical protein